jgi:hypothetical protein
VGRAGVSSNNATVVPWAFNNYRDAIQALSHCDSGEIALPFPLAAKLRKRIDIRK